VCVHRVYLSTVYDNVATMCHATCVDGVATMCLATCVDGVATMCNATYLYDDDVGPTFDMMTMMMLL
jgi:hypothetical protein